MEPFGGELRMVNPSEVIIDPSYQREQKQNLIYAISGDFRWEAFGAPTLFQRDSGKLYVADGQQRFAAIAMMEDPPMLVPAIVHVLTDVRSEAEMFVRINKYRRALSPMEMHRGDVVAENPAALAIESAVEKAGFSITPGGKHLNDIQAIGSLVRAYNDLGEDGLYEVLMVHREAWPDTQPSANMLRLITQLIVEKGESYDRRTMSDALSGVTPGQLKRKAEELGFQMAGSLRVNLRRAVTILAKL